MVKKNLVRNFEVYPKFGETPLPVAVVMIARGKIGKIRIDYGDGAIKKGSLVNDRVYKKVGTHRGRVDLFEKKTDKFPVQSIPFTVKISRASRVNLIKKVSQKGNSSIAYVGKKTGFQVVLAGSLSTGAIKDISWKFGSKNPVSSNRSRFIYPTFWIPGKFPISVSLKTHGRGSDKKTCKILVLPKNFGVRKKIR